MEKVGLYDYVEKPFTDLPKYSKQKSLLELGFCASDI